MPHASHIARADARAAGLKTYVGGTCAAGHSVRFTSTAQCVECARLRSIALREARPPKEPKAKAVKPRQASTARRTSNAAAAFAMFGYRPPTFREELSHYERSDVAHARSNYLDRLLREKIG